MAQQRFRPWNGVFLSERYLHDVDAALSVTREMLAIYREFGVIPLVESAVKDRAALKNVHGLLGL